MFYCAGDVFVVVAPTINNENVKYCLMRCTEWKRKLLEDYNDHGFPYERGSIILKGYFFRQTNESGDFVYFEDYEPDFISFRYSHLVCVAWIKLIEFQSKKKRKLRNGKCQNPIMNGLLKVAFHWNFFDWTHQQFILFGLKMFYNF